MTSAIVEIIHTPYDRPIGKSLIFVRFYKANLQRVRRLFHIETRNTPVFTWKLNSTVVYPSSNLLNSLFVLKPGGN